MLTLEINPIQQKQPFCGGGDLFYCGICKSYTPNFTASSIKTRDRRCRACLQKKRFERMQKVGHLQRLKTKLYQNFIYQGKKGIARAVTIDTVTGGSAVPWDWGVVIRSRKDYQTCIQPRE